MWKTMTGTLELLGPKEHMYSNFETKASSFEIIENKGHYFHCS